MLLTIDVGNTNITIGIFDGDALVRHWRIATDRNKSSDEIALLFKSLFDLDGMDSHSVTDVIVSSVVPPVMHSLTNAIRKCFKQEAMVVNSDTPTGLHICYDNPREVGADRIVNAAGAICRYKPPFILVDFGTATTFCAVDAEHNYLGGAILPGIKISMEALFEKTAKLPRIEITKPDHVIGTNTVESMQSGVYYGYIGSVDHIVTRMKEEMGGNVSVIATGGLARLISQDSATIEQVDSMLTLYGLLEIYKRNQKEHN